MQKLWISPIATSVNRLFERVLHYKNINQSEGGGSQSPDQANNAVNYAKAGEEKVGVLAANPHGYRSRAGNMFRFLKRGRGRRRALENRLAVFLICAGVVSGFATYASLRAVPPFGDDPNTVIWLLNLDLVILLLLVTLIAKRIVDVLSGRKRGIAGSKLHVRLVYIFSILAAAPAIIMTVFSAYFFHFGVQTWFSERVRTAVNESQAVAEAYLEEHQQVIRADVLAMATDLNRQATILTGDQAKLNRVMRTQSILRNLSEAILFDGSGRILAASGLALTLEVEEISSESMEEARQGEVVMLTSGDDNRVRALMKLDNYVDIFLFVGRMVDPDVLARVSSTRQVSEEYARLEGHYSELQVMVTLIFVVVALVLLLAAIWLGLVLARQLVAPIGTLISASDRVRAGDLTARVPEFETLDEFDYLARSFNRMTSQIQEQRDELVEANRLLDYRRRFTETILAGVSSGVIGVNESGVITMANASAADLLQKSVEALTGSNIADILPEIEELLMEAHQRSGRMTQSEVFYSGVDDIRRTFLVRIAIELIGDQDKGAVITFDDITELQSAQRKAAWADVARRIAHEIRNPLTPIQLSAERLKRKYLKEIKTDPETFSQCTDTIIRQVDDIGRMVNEFSSFARMPEPVMKAENLMKHVRDTLVLQQQAHPDIGINLIATESDRKNLPVRCDSQQVRQALTNLLQNAIDSIKATQKTGGEDYKGQVDVLVSRFEDEAVICFSDNGPGLPKDEDPGRLTEPYVTHKEKGTGLGLAIVKKIMEDHKGRLLIGAPEWVRSFKGWRGLGGATIILAMPLDEEGKSEPADEKASEAA